MHLIYTAESSPEELHSQGVRVLFCFIASKMLIPCQGTITSRVACYHANKHLALMYSFGYLAISHLIVSCLHCRIGKQSQLLLPSQQPYPPFKRCKQPKCLRHLPWAPEPLGQNRSVQSWPQPQTPRPFTENNSDLIAPRNSASLRGPRHQEIIYFLQRLCLLRQPTPRIEIIIALTTTICPDLLQACTTLSVSHVRNSGGTILVRSCATPALLRREGHGCPEVLWLASDREKTQVYRDLSLTPVSITVPDMAGT